jgi:23S rRNA-/tRNA-specific pseudouridylate synthase
MTKTPIYNSYVTELFRQHRIEKIYMALCEAVPGEAFDSSSEWPERWTIENHLAPMKRGKGVPTFMKAVLSGGKKAITDFEWLYPRSPIRVRARPRTGRMHQIRAHLSSCGLPIRGDWLYGKRSKERLYLHAESLRFQHPQTQQLLEVTSPSPF